MKQQIEKLCQALEYEFSNPELLKLALSHRSTGKQSNERMEFLGDSVLNFIIAAELFSLYPDIKEGELSRLRAFLVNGEILAELAKELNLGQYMYLGVGELKSRGFQRSSILADALEAIIGAIYLDGGIDACRKQILLWYKHRLENLPMMAPKDPKTQLQELLQGKKLPLPAYKIIKIEGAAHEQIFFVECRVNGLGNVAVGAGSSKRRAERNAAELFLKELANLNES